MALSIILLSEFNIKQSSLPFSLDSLAQSIDCKALIVLKFDNLLIGFNCALNSPKSIPFLFTSLKLGMAASLVGAIVGELPSGAIAGLGARMLSGSYYGQTIQIWSALFTAAILAASLVGLICIIQGFVFKRMMIFQ